MRVPVTYDRQFDLNSAQPREIPIDLGAVVPRAIEKVASGVGDLSTEFIKIQERQKLEQGERDVVKSMSSISDEFRNFLTTVKDNPNPEVYQDTLKFAEGLKAQYTPKSNDPRITDYYEKMFESHRKVALDSSAMIQAQYIHNDKIDTSNSAVDAGTKNAVAAANNPETLNAIISNTKNIVQTVDPNGKDALYVSGKMEKLIGNVVSDVAIYDPVRAKDILTSYKRDLPNTYDNLTLHIDNLIKAKNKEVHQLDVYSRVYDEGEGNPNKMRGIVTNPVKMKELGISIEDARAIEGQIGQLEQNKKAIYEKTEAGYLPLFATGKLKETQILNDLAKGLIDSKGAEHWIEESKKTKDIETNPISYASLVEDINNGRATITTVLRKNGISRPDKKELINRYFSEANKKVNEYEKRAEETIKHQLISTGLLGNPIQEEWQNYSDAIKELHDSADAARKKGVVWGSNEYNEKAKELSVFYKMSITDKIKAKSKELTRPSGLGINPSQSNKKRLSYDVKTGQVK